MEQPRARAAARCGGSTRRSPPTSRPGRSSGRSGTATARGSAWNNLGIALGEVGRFDEAITAYERDMAICEEFGDRYGQAQTLANLGLVHAELDDPQRARRAWADAVELFAAVGAEDDADRVREWIADLDR